MRVIAHELFPQPSISQKDYEEQKKKKKKTSSLHNKQSIIWKRVGMNEAELKHADSVRLFLFVCMNEWLGEQVFFYKTSKLFS